MTAPRRTLADQLDSGEPLVVAGQRAAFPVDVPTDPRADATSWSASPATWCEWCAASVCITCGSRSGTFEPMLDGATVRVCGECGDEVNVDVTPDTSDT